MKYLLSILIVLSCVPAFGAELSADQLFRETEFKQFRVSPGGDFVSIWRHFEDNDEIIISVPKAEQNIMVFQMPESEKTGVVQMGWIDSDSLFVKYYDFHSLPHFLVVDLQQNEDGSVTPVDKDVILRGRIIDLMPEKPDRVLFSVKLEKKKGKRGVYEIDLRDIHKDYVFTGRLNLNLRRGSNFRTDSQHRLRLATQRKDDRGNFLYFDLKEEKWRVYYSIDLEDEDDEDEEEEKEKDDDFFLPIGILNDSTIAVASNVDRNTIAVLEFKLKEKKFGKVIFGSDRYDVSSAEIDRRTGRLAMVSITEHGRTKFKYFSTKDKESKAKLERTFPNKKILLHGESLDRKKVLVHVLSESNPGTYYLLDLANAEARVLADVNPELAGVSLFLSNRIAVKSTDGLMIEGFVTMPRPGQEKHPLIVLPHGGPIGIQDTDFYDPEVQFLADRGFAVLRVNFRGSYGYGKEFQKQGVGQWGKGLEDDIDASLEHVLQNYPIDKDKVCIMGASFGGYSALMSVVRTPEKYQCAVSRIGVTDLDLILNQTNTREVKEIRKAWQSVLGDPDDPAFKPKKVSPFFLADQINVPVMLTAGWKDTVADPEHTHRLKVALEALGKPHEYLLYKEGRHGHADKGDYQHEMILIERFLRKSMGIPYPDTDRDVEIKDHENAIVATEFGKGDIEYSRSYPKSKSRSRVSKVSQKKSPAPSATPTETTATN